MIKLCILVSLSSCLFFLVGCGGVEEETNEENMACNSEGSIGCGGVEEETNEENMAYNSEGSTSESSSEEEEEFEVGADAPENLKKEDAPDFKTSLLDGNDFKLSAAKGKNVVVLDFWATWCGPCVKALPEVKAATDALKNKGVVLIAVNQGESPGDIQRFLAKRNWNTLNVGLDPEGEIAKKFGVEGIPQTVIIDKDGVIREVHVGYSPGMGKRLSKELMAILASD